MGSKPRLPPDGPAQGVCHVRENEREKSLEHVRVGNLWAYRTFAVTVRLIAVGNQ